MLPTKLDNRDGSGAIPTQALKQVLAQGGQIVVAFDADQAGELMAWRVAQELSGVRRVTPAYGKDWNDRLIHDGHPEQAPPAERDKQTLHALWQWYRVVQNLGKSQRYLNRITEVAREVANGKSLSNQARAAMQHDLKTFVQQQVRLQVRMGQSTIKQGKSQRNQGTEIEE
jgi:DNA primase